MSSPQFVLHLVFPVTDLGKTERSYTTVLKQEPQRADDSAMYQVGETPLFFTRCPQVLPAKYRKENVGLIL
jgi:hypothetical protein